MTLAGRPLSLLLVAAALSSGACAAGSAGSTSGAGGGGATSGEGGSGTGTGTTGAGGAEPMIDAGGTGGGGPGGGCSVAATRVYLLAKGQELHSFDPATLALSKVGALACPGSGAATPFSMSVDRSGKAWVLYNDGQLFNVDTETAACQKTAFVSGQGGFTKFGMGFVSDAVGGDAESLYVANADGIAKLDTTTLSIAPIGAFGFAAMAELTGTADARLFGFFYGFPPYIAQIDNATSKPLAEAPLDTIDAGTGFAFAFWGGDFWIFTATSDSDSQIHRYAPATQATTQVKASVGFKVVGAGVSTCAPLEVPK